MFIDTSGLLCLHHRRELQHDEAVQYWDERTNLLTHSYVLAEFVALADSRRLPRQPALEFVYDLVDHPSVEVVYVETALHRQGIEFLLQRLDKRWSLCDAVSFVLMQRRNLTEALTTDHHFEQAGFVRLLPR